MALRLLDCTAPIKLKREDWPRDLTFEQDGILLRLVFEMWSNQTEISVEFARTRVLRMRADTAKRVGLDRLVKFAARLVCQRAPIDQRTRQAVFSAAEYKCHYCGTRFVEADGHVDHATPVARGGKNLDENYRAACAPCNRAKRTMTEAEFIAHRNGGAR